jgi:hypothetical protein
MTEEVTGPPARGHKLRLARADEGDARDPLAAWLLRDQAQTGESDAAFAHRRGLSVHHLRNLRANRRGLSRPMVERICRRDPTARAVYIAYCLTETGPPDS